MCGIRSSSPRAFRSSTFWREAGPKYSYRELDDFTDRIEKAIKIAPEASRVTRVGVIEEQIEARYSQNRLAAFGIIPAAIRASCKVATPPCPPGP